MDQKKIGEFISSVRKEKGLTQKDLGEKLGVSINAVSKWERGLSLMDISLLKPLSEILDITIVELLSGEYIDDDIEKAYEVVENTLKYSDKKIKKQRKKIILICLLVFILIIYFGYKFILLKSVQSFRELNTVTLQEKFQTKYKNDIKLEYKNALDYYNFKGEFQIKNVFNEASIDYDNYKEISFHFPNEKIINMSIKENPKYQLDEYRYEKDIINTDYYFKKYKIDSVIDVYKLSSKIKNEKCNVNIFNSINKIQDCYFKEKIKDVLWDEFHIIDGYVNGFVKITNKKEKAVDSNIIEYNIYKSNEYIDDLIYIITFYNYTFDETKEIVSSIRFLNDFGRHYE